MNRPIALGAGSRNLLNPMAARTRLRTRDPGVAGRKHYVGQALFPPGPMSGRARPLTPIETTPTAAHARKRPVNLTLNEDLVAQARSVTANLSAVLEALLANFLAREKQKRADVIESAKQTCAMWNRVCEKYGAQPDIRD